MKIGLFYGSSTFYTEMAAEKIQAILGANMVDIYNVKETPLSVMTDYELLILGISTWDFGEIQEDWSALWDDIDTTVLSGKCVALYGLGDQEGYGEWFLDAMGLLHQKLAKQQVKRIGFWKNDESYCFDASKALTEDGSHFVGLALDEDSQYALSDERIAQWLEQVLTEYSLVMDEV